MAGRRRAKFSKGNLNATEVAIYAQYLNGERTHTVPRKPAAAKLERRDCGVIPFGMTAAGTATPASYVATTITAQGADIIASLASMNYEDFGIEPDSANVSGTLPDGVQFFPALCKPTLIAASDVGRAGTGTSAFTGRPKGRQYNSRSASIPFGRTIKAGTTDAKTGVQETTISAVDYVDVRKALMVKIKAGLGTTLKLRTITFEPEIYRPVSTGGKGKLSGYTAASVSFT
jgi:hypothetical protein